MIGHFPMYFLIGRIVDWLTQRLTRPVFRVFFQAAKVCPPLFAVVAGIGLGIGCWLTLFLRDPDPTRQLLIRIAGVICIGFYGWLEALFVIKSWNGSWGAFCDWCRNLVEDSF